MPRTGIKIDEKIDRGQQIIDNPSGYFSEAKARARAQAARDQRRLA